MANFWESIGQKQAPMQQNIPQQSGNTGGFNMQELMKFAGQMQGKNPEQMVYNYMKENGIDKSELDNMMGMAKNVMPMLKNFGIIK